MREGIRATSWNPQDLMEALFNCLEESYIMVLINKPAYTQEQMVDKALLSIQSSGLFTQAITD